MRRSDLHEYQETAIQWVLKHERCALWLDPGLGKTVISLTAMNELLNRFESRYPLVISPLRVSHSVWPLEADKWDHLKHMTCTRLYWPDSEENKAVLKLFKKEGLGQNDRDSNAEITRKMKRRDELVYNYYIPWLREKLSTKSTFYSINREQVALLCRVVYQNWPFDTVFIDEASSFKNSSSMRFKGLKAVQNKINRLVELTGSPASNGLLDVWAQSYLLDGGKALTRSMTAFKQAYFDQGFDGFKWEIKKGAEKEIHEKLFPLCLGIRAKDHLTIKNPEIVEAPVKLPGHLVEQYIQLENEYVLSLDNEETVSAPHNAALQNKLHQFCNGAVYVDDNGNMLDSNTAEKKKSRQWKEVHNEKIKALRKIYEKAEGPILVAYLFKHDLDRILKEFPEARIINTEKDIRDWNAGKIPMGVGHPASMGHGLNLQEGGSEGVFISYLWDRELYDQFIARLARQGQKEQVVIHIIFAETKVERLMKKVLFDCGNTQNKLMDAMRRGVSTL